MARIGAGGVGEVYRARDTGFPCHSWFARDPLLDPIRSNPAVAAFLDELRLKFEAVQARYRSH